MYANDASEVRQCWISSTCLDTMLLTIRLHLFKCPFYDILSQGLFAGVLEVFGLCFFAVVILLHRKFPSVLRILVINGVFIVPVMWQIFKNRLCDQEKRFNKERFMFILSLMFEIGGVGVIMYQVRQYLKAKISDMT